MAGSDPGLNRIRDDLVRDQVTASFPVIFLLLLMIMIMIIILINFSQGSDGILMIMFPPATLNDRAIQNVND